MLTSRKCAYLLSTLASTLAASLTAQVSLTPDNQALSAPQGISGQSASFTIRNLGSANATFYIFCYPYNSVTACTPSQTSMTIPPQMNIPLSATFTTGAVGTGTISLKACSNAQCSQAQDYGSYNVTVVATQVSVTPDGSTAPPRAANTTGFTQTFTVQNPGTVAAWYTLSCSATGSVTCANVTPNAINNLAPGTSTNVTANYSTTAVGLGTVSVVAQGVGAPARDDGSYEVRVVAYPISVVPDDRAVSVLASTSGLNQPFTLQNASTASVTYNLSSLCSGSLVGSCSSPAQVVLAAGATTVINVAYNSAASGTGRVRLLATNAANSAVSDSGWVNVSLGTAQAATVSTSGVNSGNVVERGLCLTFAVGKGSAVECGDLRIAHSLPTTTTLGKARTPVLIYNSQHAQPNPLVAAQVTVPAGAANPDSIVAKLWVNNTVRGKGQWSGREWVPGGVNRNVVADTLVPALPTGLYDYTLEVVSWYGSVPTTASTSAGQYVVVNRTSSPFGPGWWIAGLEQLYFPADPTKVWWLNGDGSFREYEQVTGTNTFRAPSLSRLDSLVRLGSPGNYTYTRYLPHGLRTQFDNSGRHSATTNRLGQTTTFQYDGSNRPWKIVLPPDPAKLYQFVYNATSGLLDSVIAPPAGSANRAVTISRTGSLITTIRDADLKSEGLAYLATTNRVSSRSNRRGTATSFTYDLGQKISQSSIDMGTGRQPIVERFRAVESQGLAGSGSPSSIDTSSAYTSLNGSRLGVGDTMSFWVDRFGNPRRIVDALGHETIVTRAEPTFPVLVTKVRAPNGQVTTASYDAHGNVISSTDSSTHVFRIVGDQGVLLYATTQYRWDPLWDYVTAIVPPEKDSVVFAYDPVNGNRLWQQDSRGASSRVNFFYYQNGSAAGRMRSLQIPTQGPSDPRDSLTYDALGNLAATKTPSGLWTTSARDGLGRDTLTLTPIDNAQTLFARQRTQYDLMDRDTLDVSIGPQMPGTNGHPPDTLYVRKVYNAEGLVDTLTRRAGPDRNSLGTVRAVSRYDAAGRKVAEVAADGGVDSSVYDPAANVIQLITRRGHSVTATYDVLNRPVQRVVPSLTFASVTSTAGVGGPRTFPRYPNNGTSLTLDADVSNYEYDMVGNLIRADNGNAWVHRIYNQNGTLQSDSLYIRTYIGNDFNTHKYGLGFSYDLDQRRIQMDIPTQLAPPEGGATQWYSYNSHGLLLSVMDLLGKEYSFSYDLDGRADMLYSPGGITTHPTYDLDSRPYRSQITASAFVGSDTGFASATVRDDQLAFDASGKVQSAIMLGRQRFSQYSGLGMVSRDSTMDTRSYGNFWSMESATWDGIGNMATSFDAGSRCQGLNDHYTYQPGTARQTARSEGVCAFNSAADPATGGDWDSTDASGNLVRQRRWWTGNVYCDPYPTNCQIYLDPVEETFSYYSADQRLRVIDRQRFRYQNNDSLYATFFEEYRYDALGRRVLKRSRANFACPTSLYCKSSIERYVWDDAQILAEIRYPGWETVTQADLERDTPTLDADGRFYGRVLYTHAGGIDRPLGVIRVGYGEDFADGLGYAHFPSFALTPHFSWEQIIDAASYETGASRRCLSPVNASGHYYRCVQNAFPTRAAQQRNDKNVQHRPILWMGSLLQGKMDETGQVYMRNRYLDPVTGRFTQEDPAGLAGGVNEYGFAAGDVVNYGDPFGLWWSPFNNFNLDWYFYTTAQEQLAQAQLRDAQGITLTPPPECICLSEEREWTPANTSPGILDPVAIVSGGIAGWADGLIAGSAERAGARVLANKAAGDAFRDEIAALFESEGYQVEKEVVKQTPFGRRVIDIEVSRDGTVLGGIETKTGASRYTSSQQSKDAWLALMGYIVQLVR